MREIPPRYRVLRRNGNLILEYNNDRRRLYRPRDVTGSPPVTPYEYDRRRAPQEPSVAPSSRATRNAAPRQADAQTADHERAAREAANRQAIHQRIAAQQSNSATGIPPPLGSGTRVEASLGIRISDSSQKEPSDDIRVRPMAEAATPRTTPRIATEMSATQKMDTAQKTVPQNVAKQTVSPAPKHVSTAEPTGVNGENYNSLTFSEALGEVEMNPWAGSDTATVVRASDGDLPQKLYSGMEKVGLESVRPQSSTRTVKPAPPSDLASNLATRASSVAGDRTVTASGGYKKFSGVELIEQWRKEVVPGPPAPADPIDEDSLYQDAAPRDALGSAYNDSLYQDARSHLATGTLVTAPEEQEQEVQKPAMPGSFPRLL